ncbi:unnamed protein product [Musa banksii]
MALEQERGRTAGNIRPLQHGAQESINHTTHSSNPPSQAAYVVDRLVATDDDVLSQETVQEFVNGGVLDVREQRRGLHAERWLDLEVGVVTLHKGGVANREHDVERDWRL